jgi:hypothetical protein
VTAAIGQGGMGQVFRARDTKLNRDVALKILPDSFASDVERRQRFEREARTLAALNHPGIAQIYTPELHVPLDPAKEVDAHALTMAPGNRLVLAVHVRGADDAQRLDIVENGRRAPLSSDTDVWGPKFVLPNNLLFVRRLTNPGVWTAPFENGALDLTRAAMVQPGATGLDAARDGTLLMRFMARNRRNLVWVTRSGQTTPVPGSALEMTSSSFQLAPEGGRVLMSTLGPDFRADVVVRDLRTGTDTRVAPPRPAGAMTVGASVAWAPAGRLFFGVGGIETSEIYDWPADGSAGGRKLLAGTTARMRPGRQEIYFTRDERGALRLRRAPLAPDGTASTSEAVFPANGEPNVHWFDVSPDGQLLAFTDRSGNERQMNVFVTKLPDLRERRQITSNGGSRPRFSRDGKSLWYFSPTRPDGAARGQVSVVPLTTDPLAVGAPSVVLVQDAADGTQFPLFDVSADGRLLVTRRADPQPGDEARVVLMQNWQAAIRK